MNMNLLQQVQRGRSHLPPRILVYGTEGVGCDKFPLARSFEDVYAALSELETQEHGYETVAIDSLDWLERLIWDAVCRRESATTIEKVGGGYGKGYTLALDYWRKLIEKLSNLHRDRGMMIFLIAHAKVEKFEDPEAPAYDRYSPRLHKHAGAIITEWCDAVLFATKRFTTRTEESGFGRQRAIAAPIGAAGGERILKTVGGPSCVAKNRYRLKPEIPLAWDAIVGGILGSASELSNPVSVPEGVTNLG
jgi:hypothetical protein